MVLPHPPETGGRNTISEASERLATKFAPTTPSIATLKPESYIGVSRNRSISCLAVDP